MTREQAIRKRENLLPRGVLRGSLLQRTIHHSTGCQMRPVGRAIRFGFSQWAIPVQRPAKWPAPRAGFVLIAFIPLQQIERCPLGYRCPSLTATSNQYFGMDDTFVQWICRRASATIMLNSG